MAEQDGQPSRDSQEGRKLFAFGAFLALIGVAVAIWPFIDSLNPSAERRARNTWVALDSIPPGERRTVYWRRLPVAVFHRTPEQIAAARADDSAAMMFPHSDRDRVQRPAWLVVLPRCWKGALPQGQAPDEPRGQWGGWYCPYHGDAYDLSGRLRTMWGEANFVVPPHSFREDRWLIIGEAP